jgi:hypothetical protein
MDQELKKNHIDPLSFPIKSSHILDGPDFDDDDDDFIPLPVETTTTVASHAAVARSAPRKKRRTTSAHSLPVIEPILSILPVKKDITFSDDVKDEGETVYCICRQGKLFQPFFLKKF